MQGIVTASAIIAAVLFVLSLSGLSRQETARRGNLFGMLGMALAFIAVSIASVENPGLLAAAVVPAAIIGAIVASRVAMTSMPQLVAMLHSFVGLAAVLVGLASHFRPLEELHATEALIHATEIFIGIFIGAITFTGSIIAFGKLQGVIRSKPLLMPGRHLLNIIAVLACVYFGVVYVGQGHELQPLLIMTGIGFFIGWHMVMAIGGADMPVVVSMLNSYSGWAAAAAGFMLGNDLLIVTGALVGSSGAILSLIMCRAMNRSFISVILGGFGSSAGSAPAGGGSEITGEASPIEVDECAELMADAKKIVIVPGYGMAVARAQHPVHEMTRILRDKGITVEFAIHPVAGRLPGHMNVLLAEAGVPYDIVLEMDEINPDIDQADVVLVIGANDIVNPAALDDPTCEIAGMPVIEVWRASTTVVMKRSLATGYAGIANPLFFKDNTRMLFGDAKTNVDALVAALR